MNFAALSVYCKYSSSPLVDVSLLYIVQNLVGCDLLARRVSGLIELALGYEVSGTIVPSREEYLMCTPILAYDYCASAIL